MPGRCSDNEVVITSHLSRAFEFRPDSGMLAGDLRRVVNYWKPGENGFHVTQPPMAMLTLRALHSMP